MYEEEIKAYQEQLSSLNQLVIDLQQELYEQKQNVDILENDIMELDKKSFRDNKLFFEYSPNAVIILDGFGKIKNLNQSASNFLGRKKHFILELSFRSLLDQVVFNEFTNKFHNFINSEDVEFVTFHFLQLKNKTSFSLTLKKLIVNELKNNDIIMGVINSYSNDDSQHSNYLSHIVLEQLKDGVIITDDKGEILKINNAFTEITGYTIGEVLGKNPKLLKSGRHTSSFYEKMWRDIEHHGWWAGEIWNRRKNGEVYPEWLQITRVIEPITKKIFYTSIFSDITDRKKHQFELDRLAHYDTLTGLVNRHFLQISLSNILLKSKDRDTMNGLLYLDLDHFKQINDIYGHQEGDLLLQEAAQRLLTVVRTSDIVARVGGDEFIIVLSRIQDEDIVLEIADNIIKELRKPFFINNNEHIIGASVGVVFSPKHGTEIKELMSRADSAMYMAKKMGRNQISIFRPEDELLIQEKDIFKNLLLQVIKNPDKFIEIYYQPIINVKDNSLFSMEALLRVKDLDGNFVNPEDIILVAEAEGLIHELGNLIFRKICEFYSQNIELKFKLVPITVNLSILQIIKDDFLDSFKTISYEYNLDISDFNFEITETTTMQNLENILNIINSIKRSGSSIYLDDFGTGYASLSQLHNLPLDVVKIDKSFTFRLDEDKQARNMVKAMVSMVHELDYKIVIEGVETEHSLEWLKSINVDYVQGYYFSKPLSCDEIRKNYLS